MFSGFYALHLLSAPRWSPQSPSQDGNNNMYRHRRIATANFLIDKTMQIDSPWITQCRQALSCHRNLSFHFPLQALSETAGSSLTSTGLTASTETILDPISTPLPSMATIEKAVTRLPAEILREIFKLVHSITEPRDTGIFAKHLEWRSQRGTKLSQLHIEVYGRPKDEDGGIGRDSQHNAQLARLQMVVNGPVEYVDVPSAPWQTDDYSDSSKSSVEPVSKHNGAHEK
ncbi:hypothetical protein NUW54_g9644 [Trametes sanguinea]|uniref:Uncharacterized protein n=1 Tax=Trametes sanguinea TaxID=158606 RepID=A0ACC1P4E7_9APHY|nr:hypothetical protein NUW54_g9644 [Trametes sanguinea]